MAFQKNSGALASIQSKETDWWYYSKQTKEKSENLTALVCLPGLLEEFVGMVRQACPQRSRRVEAPRARMFEAGRQVNGLFESMLSQSFGE